MTFQANERRSALAIAPEAVVAYSAIMSAYLLAIVVIYLKPHWDYIITSLHPFHAPFRDRLIAL